METQAQARFKKLLKEVNKIGLKSKSERLQSDYRNTNYDQNGEEIDEN